MARELAHLMTPLLGQQVIVENKGGAAGAIGARFVSNAKPDGYTIFYAVGTNVVTNPHVLKSSIDTLKGWCRSSRPPTTSTCWRSIPTCRPTTSRS